MRVLGVDPGLTRCGVAVVDGSSGHRARMVAVDVVRTPPGDEIELRLLAVHDAVALWIEEYRPDVVAVERVFAQHNVRSVMGTAQAAGVVMVAAARGGVRVAGHTPSEVKAAVTGSGRAGKEQVATMVARVLGLSETPGPPDASDALALALCQLWRGRGQARLLTATATTTATTTAGGSGRSAVGRRGGGRTVPPGR